MAAQTAPMRRRRPSSPTEVSRSRNSYFFQPPHTPAESSPYMTTQSYDGSVGASRKRTRPGLSPIQRDSRTSSNNLNSFASGLDTPFGRHGSNWTAGSAGWLDVGSATSIARSDRDVASPMPFVNTRYELRGGMETPGQDIDTRADGTQLPDNEFRSRWNESKRDSGIGEDVQRAEHGKYDNMGKTPNGGWGKMVYSLAGAMWNFCTSVPFRGFYAGGGRGSAVDANSHESLSQAQSMWETLDTMRTPSEQPFFARSMTPMPGGFPSAPPPPQPQFHEQETPPRPSKRQHTDPNMNNGNTWLLVPPRGLGECTDISTTQPTPTRPESPFRLTERKAPSKSYIPRPSSAFDRALSPKPRPSLIPVSRRTSSTAALQTSPSHARPSSRQSSYAPLGSGPRASTALGFSNTHASTASPRCYTPTNPFRPSTPSHSRGNSANQPHYTSPHDVSPELALYEARRREEEEIADETLTGMNRRLTELISLGQRALSSGYSDYGAGDATMEWGEDEGFGEGLHEGKRGWR